MKHVTGGLFLVVFLSSISCSVFMGKMLQMDPEFAKSADKYSISHPPRPGTLTVEDGRTNEIYEMNVEWSRETDTEDPIDESALDKGDVAREKNLVAHKGLLQNPVDGKSYEIIGTTTTHRSVERDSNNTTVETTTLRFPFRFSIFEQGQDVGTITVGGASLPLLIDVSLHERLVSVEHSLRPNQKQVVLKSENEQIAFFDVKSEGSIGTKFKGNAYLKPGLTKELTADAFTSYTIAVAMMGIIADK